MTDSSSHQQPASMRHVGQAPAAEALECAHCGALVSPKAAVYSGDQPFCCSGCATVADIVRAGGWNNFYEQREGWSPRPDSASVAAFDSEAFQHGNVRTREDGLCEVDLQVGKLRCAACTWLVEKAVEDMDGVEDVFVSYGSGRARLAWDPDKLPLSNIAGRIQALGYEPRAAHEAPKRDYELLTRFGVAAFCAGNIMLVAIAVYLGWLDSMAEHHLALFRWVVLVIATPAVLFSSSLFFDRAIEGLKHKIVSMDVPVALAVAIMYGHGVWATFTHQDGYLDSLTMLIALLLGGRLLEEAGRNRARDAATAVLAEAPTTARRIRDGRVEEVAAADIQLGDTVVVGQGSAVPVDGRVVAGNARVDLSLLTGESEPVSLVPGVETAAGAMVIRGELELEATAIGDATLLSRMAQRVADARSSRSPVSQLADQIAPYFTVGTVGLAVAAFIGWSVLTDVATAIPITIAVLVVACPCALALAGPAAVAAGLGAAARRGAYVRDASTLLALADLDRAFLDKTGTMTEGKPRVVEADDEALRLASGLERGSSHPVAKAILDEVTTRRIPISAASDIDEVPGVGVTGTVDGMQVAVRAHSDNRVGVWADGDLVGTILVRDRVRSRARADIGALRMPVTMLTGDSPEVAARIGAELGVETVHAGLSPEEKHDAISQAQAKGEKVLFVGDGLNDAPALAASDVGVAMGSGAAASILAADVVVLNDHIEPVVAAREAAMLTKRIIHQNNTFSIIYNIAAVGLAVAGLINPLVAAILMPLSSLTVIGGALSIEPRLKNGHHRRTAAAESLDRGTLPLSLHASST